MTAICKTKLIHGTNLQPLLDYGSNQEKTSYTDNALEEALDYAANPLKTIAKMEDGHKELLVTGVLCEPETALLDFAMVRERYLELHGPERIYRYEYFDKRTGETRNARRDPVTAIHLIQSFAETDLDPRTVHQIGIDLCERLGVMAVVDTHLNTGHLHNHIVINAYMPDGKKKFSMDKAAILHIRELSDQLQQEYGIELKFDTPWRQLQQSKGHDTYGEWKARNKSLSWKEEMREEMAAARSVSDSREDFIAIMQDYGYEIARQDADSIVWWNKDHTRKIRDRTLGEAYGLGALFPDNAPAPEYVIQSGPSPERKRPRALSVARYDWNGRRRSDLELLIRKAIALIQHAGSRYHSHTAIRSVSQKIEMMEQAIETVRHMELEDHTDLKEHLDQTGARLSHVKSSLRKMEAKKQFYDSLEPLLSSLQATKHQIDSIRYWPEGKAPDLMLKEYSPADSGKIRAELFPMSGSQKRELYLKLKAHPEVTLAGNGFSEVSAMDAEEIFAYFKGTRTERPSCLRDSTQVTMEQVYKKRSDHLRASFSKPIQKYQRKHLEELLSSHSLTADMDALTQFDAINIENCLGANPFSKQPIDTEKQSYLHIRLRDDSLSTSRELKYILPGEYEAILNYLDGLQRTKPAILKPSPKLDAMTAEKLQTFMDAKKISCSIPVTAMTKSDYDKMYGHVISQDQTPDCAMTAPTDKDRTEEFHKSIAVEGITEKKQLLLSQLRNQMNELLELGLDPSHPEALEKEISDFRKTYDALEAQRTELAQEYKALLRLSQQITYAESPSFIFGPLFNEKVHETPEVTEQEEQDKKPEKEKNPDKPPRRNPVFDIDLD